MESDECFRPVYECRWAEISLLSTGIFYTVAAPLFLCVCVCVSVVVCPCESVLGVFACVHFCVSVVPILVCVCVCARAY